MRPCLLLSPSLCVLGSDLLRRGDRIVAFEGWHRLTYIAGWAEAALVWALLLAGSCGKDWAAWLCRTLFVSFFVLSFGGQAYFFQQYNTYLSVDVSLFASDFMGSVLGQLLADLGNYLSVSWVAILFALASAGAAAHGAWLSPRGAALSGRLAPLALVVAFFVPTQHRHFQASPPDALYLHAAGGLLRTQLGWSQQSGQHRPSPRRSLPVGKLVSRAPLQRNVLLVILESVRADAVCRGYDPDCEVTRATNELFPQRIPLEELRALDSSTAISLAVLWSGLGPHESRETLHTWPLLFDYAHAASWHSVFWTSQNLLFGNSRLWVEGLPVQSLISATDIDPQSDIDLGVAEDLFADRVIDELPTLAEPFLAVVQLSNGHSPYLVDATGPQPFQPASTSKAPEDAKEHFNHYKNAVHQQDRHLARLLKELRATEAGRRTVVIYTSDHGEAFREHSQSGHTFSVFDEEIKVPGWIDAPTGTLTQTERAHLEVKRRAFSFHPDLTATILDLMGLWDDPEIRRFRTRMLGVSLLRASSNRGALPLTNCSGVWSCAYENWGYMSGSLKLLARAWDPEWQCFDLSRDPQERRDLGPAACGDLARRALTTFGRLPGRRDD